MSSVNDDPDAVDLGRRLRIVRQEAGLSQRALAKKAGVANSVVSQIEGGKISPSVSTLKRILAGVPIGVAEFFAFEVMPERKVFFAAEELREIGKGGLSLKQVGNNLLGRNLQILYETYQPNADTGRVVYSHEGEEGGVVIAGRVEVTVGDDRRILGPGDAYLFDSRLPHRFRAVGPDKCVIVSACTPPGF